MLKQTKTIVVALAFILGFSGISSAKVPNVVVTIKPLHSIVSAIMGDLGTPTLLVKGGGDPHSYALKPSDAQAIHDADLIVWIGDSFETFLAKPLSTMTNDVAVVTLSENPKAYTLDIRTSAGEHHAGEVDPHMWLDPRNMTELAREVGNVLSVIDPENEGVYAHNTQQIMFKTERARRALEFGLHAERGRPFYVFHDGYQYLERGFGLNIVGYLAEDTNRAVSAKRLSDAKKLILEKQVVCVMSEPQFDPKLLNTLTEGLDINRGQLDAIGAELAPGPHLYTELMDKNLKALKTCLNRKKQ